MHKIKQDAFEMKSLFLAQKTEEIGGLLNRSWEHKKNTAHEISNKLIDEIYETAIKSGARGGKISGAGGGGYLIFYCPKSAKDNVIKELSKFGGICTNFSFTNSGAESWTVK